MVGKTDGSNQISEGENQGDLLTLSNEYRSLVLRNGTTNWFSAASENLILESCSLDFNLLKKNLFLSALLISDIIPYPTVSEISF